MSETLNFKPYARLLTMLGDQLITNERVALVEIIKNAYDADADWVKVTFSGFGKQFQITPNSKIIIEDDGVGMTRHVLTEHWVSPATPIKKIGKDTQDATAKGRKIQGEKGIGRFAILKLGRTVSVVSRPEGLQSEYTLGLDLSQYDDDFLKENNKERLLLLKDIELDFSTTAKARVIREGDIALGTRSVPRKPHGTRIEISNLRGSWTAKKVTDVYDDLIRLQSIFDDSEELTNEKLNAKNAVPDFEVLIYKDEVFQPFSNEYLTKLRRLIKQDAVLRITDGAYDEPSKAFKFSLNGRPVELPLSDPDISGMKIFRDIYGQKGEVLSGRGTKCGSFSFGFYVFDFDRDPNSRHFLNGEDRAILKAHRIYLYRDKIRVYPYGDPDDDWLQIDAYRGKIAAGWFLSNDQVVGFVNITQKGNPKLRDKTNREGLIDIGDATSDFIHLLQIFLAWVRKKPYGQYLAKQKKSKDVQIVKKEQVKAALDLVAEKLGNNRPAQTALAQAAKLYIQERSYLIQRAETTESLAGVGLSVETASHDIMSVMHRGLISLDSLITETQKPGSLSKELVGRELISLRGMLSFVETQLKDIQQLFKSTKSRRKDIRVKDVLEKVQRLFATSLTRDGVNFRIIEKGSSPLVAKTTDAVLLQLFLNLFDNSLYWLHSKPAGRRQIEVLLDGDENQLIFSDNGPGVKADDAPFIFEPFYSGKGEEGRGLGLYIARQLLDKHDYAIELADLKRHQLLGGANFVVSLLQAEE
jgi:signal transduction histidine kinase